MEATRATYNLFGLTVETSQPLLRSPQVARQTAVDLRLEFVGPYDPAKDTLDWHPVTFTLRRHGQRIEVARSGHRIRLTYGTRFGTVVAISDLGATSIKIARGDGATDADLASVCLGTVMGFALRRRGLACLHASVVYVDGRSYAFLGRSGTGKSTMAAAFMRYAGAQLIADDMAVLDAVGGTFTARTGYPACRLNDDAMSAIGTVPSTSEDFVYASQLGKRYMWLAEHDVVDRHLPLSAIFDLSDASSVQDHPLEEALALQSLSRQSYASYALIERADVRTEFEALAQISRNVPVIPCAGHTGLDNLPARVSHIQEIGGRL